MAVNDGPCGCLRPFIAPMLRSFALWLLVINLGVAFGAGIYEARVMIPAWAGLPPQHRPPVLGLRHHHSTHIDHVG
jgi:hypothetical protein